MIGVRKNSGVIRLLMAAALVLFVAACSSSSNNSGIERERDQALETVEELEGTVLDLTGSVEDLMGQLAALQGTDAAQEKIDMLEARIAELEGIEKDVNDAAEAEKRASVLALFKGLDPRINRFAPPSAGGAETLTAAETRFDITAVVDTSDVDTVQPKVALSVTHGKATKVTPVDAAQPDGTLFRNNKLADATGSLSDAQEPWSSTVVEATDTAKHKDTVVVFTDIAPDKSVLFEKVFTLDGGAVLAEGAALPVLNTHSKYIASEAFPTDPGVTEHNPTENVPTDIVRISGTFAGAAGEFRCTEGGDDGSCTSQGTNNGVQLNGVWVFDPNDGAMAQQADSSYSNFGWWWRIAANGNYDLDVFHGNHDGRPLTELGFDTLTDTATYVGPAAGKFAISPQLPGREVMGGHFTATATLTADFEEGTEGEITGSVHDFMQDDVSLPFEVTLPKADVSNATAGAAFFGSDVVWSIDGEKSGSKGTWSGNFWDQGGDDVPTTVTGEFAATYNEEVGRIEGAFGATLQSE